jgi:hypothetical protein
MIGHFERAAELAGHKHLGGRCEARSTQAIECARIGSERNDEVLLRRARKAAEETLEMVRRIPGKLPWEPEANAALAIVAHAEGDETTAADHARAALDIDGETFLTQYINVLWAAGRTLIASGQPEAAALSAEVLAGFGFINMTMSNPSTRARWFSLPKHRELAEIVGFDPSVAWDGDPGGVDLTGDELALLRDIASGTRTGSDDVGGLLAKLGVDTETEAIEAAIKAGVTWH